MRTQVEAALFASLLHRWSPAGWKTIINLRQDLVQGYQIPFCPSLGTEGNLAKNLRLRFSVSRNFRVPTMNDRFWQPGGNPSVLPESSWNQEAGLDLAVSGRNQSLRGVISVTLYNLLIHNLIQWVSITPSVWSPRNVQQVWSRGAEASFKVYYQIVPVSGYFQLLYNYSPSTYSQPQTAGDETAGRQLIYIPLHKFNTAFSVNVHKFYGFLNTLVTGIRFVQKDNSKSLPAYSLTNLTLGYRFQGRASGCRLQFEIRNLFNTQFQSVQYYPEPGRSFQLNLLISLKLKTQS